MKISLMVLLMMFGINAYAEINKWVDENGRVHYSDQQPPVSIKTKKLRASSGSMDSPDASGETASSEPAAPKTIEEREVELRKAQQAKKEAADKAAKEQADEDASKEYCAHAKLSLKALQEGMRIAQIDATGERSYLDDEQRQQRIAKTQQDISRNCK